MTARGIVLSGLLGFFAERRGALESYKAEDRDYHAEADVL